jgi:hypothetical protein
MFKPRVRGSVSQCLLLPFIQNVCIPQTKQDALADYYSQRNVNIGTISDMVSNFLNLPWELRDQIYTLVLLHQEPIGLCGVNSDQFTPGLFRVSKIIYYEATSLFYTKNRFDFTGRAVEHIRRSFSQIGRYNADYIQHICIGFPAFVVDRESGNVTLENDTDAILTNIQSCCANLRTLTISLYGGDAISELDAVWLQRDKQENLKVVTEVLKLVNSRLRAISSLQEIIVETDEDGPNFHIQRRMESHGWKINVVEFEEEDGPRVDEWHNNGHPIPRRRVGFI